MSAPRLRARVPAGTAPVMRAVLLALLLLLPSSPSLAEEAPLDLDVVPLALVSPGGAERHEFRVEVARTSAEQARGLMYRRELAPDAGMLFVNRRARVANFWMKNTFIPLDMIWIAERRGEYRVVGVHENAVPHSTASISSNVPVIATLEVPGGTAARLGIGPGHIVETPALGE